MKLKLALATATALGLAMGTAWAGSSNTLYISQSGSDNTANVHQSGNSTVGSGNDIGKLHAPVVQDGQGNYLKYSNDFYHAGSDNDIVKLQQDGNDNWFEVRDAGAGNTRINNVLQNGNTNQMTVIRTGEQSSTIDKVLMDGHDNTVYVRQLPIYRPGFPNPAGGHNTISLIKIVGHNNGVPSATGGALYGPGVYIQQTGSGTAGGVYNAIDEVSIEGSNNSPNAFGWDTVISVKQEGSYNGRIASIARMKGSNGNGIRISEIGDWNNFDVRQGVSTSSTGNYATVSQIGSYNSATATQYGNGNGLTVNQNGNYNTASTLFTGNDNGVGSFVAGSAAATLDGASTDLTQGVVLQNSSAALTGNTLDYNVHGSRNLFAFAQIGGGNTIDGNVGSGSHYSSDNQAAVLQTGSYNTTSFSQTGAGGNTVAVSQ
jgi:hypothetical protein